jgi:hypothetical protein
VPPVVVNVTTAGAPSSRTASTVAAAMACSVGVAPMRSRCSIGMSYFGPSSNAVVRSISPAMRTIASTARNGYFPAAVSPDSMTASVPSNSALATSLASARVGRGFSIMDSSICVAVMTGRPYRFASWMIRFCAIGTCSNGSSTPRSPRATMTASVRVRIGSMFSSAVSFSIFATISACSRDARAQVTDVVGALHEGEADVVDVHGLANSRSGCPSP